MASPAFDVQAFDVAAFDVNAFDLEESIGPTPTGGGSFERRRVGAFVKRGGFTTVSRSR